MTQAPASSPPCARPGAGRLHPGAEVRAAGRAGGAGLPRRAAPAGQCTPAADIDWQSSSPTRGCAA